jgi:glycosyltransferase involved in cell wall biosynthesis
VHAALPRITVIIPTYRRTDALRACLRSLTKLDYPRESFDVVVVDDGGDLPALDIKAEFQAPLNLSVLTQENAGPGAARNTAARAARGDYLAFIDDDCMAEVDWLKVHASAIAAHPHSLLGGRSRNHLADNVYSAASQHLIDCLYEYFACHESPAFFFATNNLVVPRQQFLELQGFDGELMRFASEDREFCARWSGRGQDMRFIPEAMVSHAHALTLRSFWEQHYAYGRGAYRLRLARLRRGQGPLRIEPVWFFINLFLYPLKRARGFAIVRLALLMLLTHVANLGGFLAEASAQGTAGRGSMGGSARLGAGDITMIPPPLSARIYQGLRRFVSHARLMPAVTAYEKAANWMRYGDPKFPRSIGIEVTTHCNRACSYCPQSVDKLQARHIDWEVYRLILERVSEMRWSGSLDFHFYNEPLLEENLESLVGMARATCPRVLPRIFTNGDLLTEKRLRSLAAAGVINFNVTRHPPYNEEWDRRMGSLAARYPHCLQWTCIEDWPLSNRAGLVKPRRVASLKAGCYMTSYSLPIDIDGRYLFCCCDYYRQHVLGNVREHGLVEAWNNPTYRAARLQVNAGNPSIDICRSCFGVNGGSRRNGAPLED